MINYNDKSFRPISHSANGESSEATIFHYRQEGDLLWATYSGGNIRRGQLIGSVNSEGCISMHYQHINDQGELMTGRCQSTPEVLHNGRIRLHETWQWETGDRSTGTSVLEECTAEQS